AAKRVTGGRPGGARCRSAEDEGPPVETGGPALREAADTACFTSLGYEAGLRWRRTTSALPVPGPLLLPEGWPLSYGLSLVGQPTKRLELYSNQSAAVVVGMTGRWVATYFSIGARSAVCSSGLWSLASFCRAVWMSPSLSCSKLPVPPPIRLASSQLS